MGESFEKQGLRPSYGPIGLDFETRSVRRLNDDRDFITLTPQQYQILWLLMRAQGAFVSESRIAEFLDESIPDDKDIPISKARISAPLTNIRNKLATLIGDEVTIDNKRGLGWYLKVKTS